jgi:Phosphotransferase enzyme family
MYPRSASDIWRAAETLLGHPLNRLVPAGSGANSHVFRAEDGVANFAVKLYPDRPGDQRPRVANEWLSLSFLRKHEVAAAPRPIAHDVSRSLLIMEWVEGTPIDVPSDADITACLTFLAQIFALSESAREAGFVLASEACLSGGEILRQILARRAQFIAHSGLQCFLDTVFDPLLARTVASTANSQSDVALPPPLRRLVPADFGFHNAIREAGGGLRFIDFDYFGWDDPVKLAADFVLHPAMTLTAAQRRRFVAGLAELLPDDAGFLDRLLRHQPFYALRWALILLNPFRRDRQADPATESVLDRQLAKANGMAELAAAALARALSTLPATPSAVS